MRLFYTTINANDELIGCAGIISTRVAIVFVDAN